MEEGTGVGEGGEITPGRLLMGVGVGRGGVGVASPVTKVSSAQIPVSISSAGVRYWLGTERSVASSDDELEVSEEGVGVAPWGVAPYGVAPLVPGPDSATAIAVR